MTTGGASAGAESGLKTLEQENDVTDPSYKMLLPLLVFSAAILLIGLHPAPLMEFLTMIGGEAG